MSASRVMTVSPPGRRSLASAPITRTVLSIHSIWGELEASTTIVFGNSVTLSGKVSDHKVGEKVDVLAEPSGASSFTTLTSVDTTAGGQWTDVVKPTIETSYQAKWKSATSSTVTVKVRPLITLILVNLSTGTFSTTNAYSSRCRTSRVATHTYSWTTCITLRARISQIFSIECAGVCAKCERIATGTIAASSARPGASSVINARLISLARRIRAASVASRLIAICGDFRMHSSIASRVRTRTSVGSSEIAGNRLRPATPRPALAGREAVTDDVREFTAFVGGIARRDRVAGKHRQIRLPAEDLTKSPLVARGAGQVGRLDEVLLNRFAAMGGDNPAGGQTPGEERLIAVLAGDGKC